MQVPQNESILALEEAIPENSLIFQPSLQIKQFFSDSSVHFKQPVKAVLQTSLSVQIVFTEKFNSERKTKEKRRKLMIDFIEFLFRFNFANKFIQ